MVTPETQAYLAEVKAPTVVAPAEVQAAVKAFVNSGAKVGQEAQLLARLLQSAAISEPNVELRGQFEAGFQALNALQREAGAAELALRNVVDVLRRFAAWDAQTRQLAKSLGYTV